MQETLEGEWNLRRNKRKEWKRERVKKKFRKKVKIILAIIVISKKKWEDKKRTKWVHDL